MPNKISNGKQKGLEAVSDGRGIIAALAVDQRSALRTLLAKGKGVAPESVAAETLVEFKEAVSRILTPHASAILLDAEFGLPAARHRAKTAGLLLAYEQTGYDQGIPGRLPRLLEHWSVRRLVGAGADCVKALLYYSSASAEQVNERKHAWVERIGAECAAADVPFFLELVSYHDQLEGKSKDFAKVKPEMVTQGVAEFSKPQYGVDVLKVGVPVSMAYVEGTSGSEADWVYTRQEAKDCFRMASDAARIPFIYLSEGVNNEVFDEALQLAAEAGATFSGVLCGRSTWKEGVPVFLNNGVPALEEWLNDQGIKNIQHVNARLAAAKPWFACDKP